MSEEMAGSLRYREISSENRAVSSLPNWLVTLVCPFPKIIEKWDALKTVQVGPDSPRDKESEM